MDENFGYETKFELNIFLKKQPSGGTQGQATDIEIHAREILKMRDMLNGLYNRHTQQSVDKVSRALERDFFMTAEEAKEFGIVDEVIGRRPDAVGDDDHAGRKKEGN